MDSTEEDIRLPAAAAPPSAHLYRLLDWEDASLASLRVRLSGFPEVEFGRGPAHATHVLQRGSARVLRLERADRWTSSMHAKLRRGLLEDAGSKNGTWVNGEAVTSQQLEDGDVIDVGHVSYLYRAAQPSLGEPLVEGAPATLSPGFHEELQRLTAVAASRVPVLLQGETGTGKEVLARAVHRWSARAGPFVAVNCAALPRTLAESELFGYRKGAFSGASEDRPGFFRSADGGTLLLDEIGDLALETQGTLLRVLQEGEVVPVGATKPVRVDVRVVAASHRDLPAMAARGEFRADLLARLSGYVVKLPPLRERREDLGVLIAALLARIAPGRKVAFEPDAARALLTYDWPMNVRELEKALASALALSGERIPLAALPESLRAPSVPVTGDERRDRIVALLKQHAGNVTAVAHAMELSRMQVHRWLKHYGIDAGAFRRR